MAELSVQMIGNNISLQFLLRSSLPVNITLKKNNKFQVLNKHEMPSLSDRFECTQTMLEKLLPGGSVAKLAIQMIGDKASL